MNSGDVLCGNIQVGGVMKTSKVTKLGQGWVPATQEASWMVSGMTNTMSVSPLGKEPPTNTSMDSGIAGLRDTPIHTPAPTHQNANIVANINNGGNNNKAEEYDIPKFIVDQTTRTTYKTGRFLGKGGFARVHELTDLTTNKTYAGKIIPKCRITKPHHKEKIAREIDVHRNLVHRHVVRFHHYFEDDNNVYIILESCSKRSLVHVLKHRRTLTEPEVRYYLRQLAEGVAYVHRHQIIHRDLKLGNMFLTEDMQVKIGDFGLATRVEDNKNVTICGTPNYIAPEVLNKFGHSYEADVWAMGCIMYALLVGQPPFETETLKETYSRITSNKYSIPLFVSESAASLIRRLLHPDPKQRPNLDNMLNHSFFTSGFMPRSIPPSACTQIPKLTLDSIGKSPSMPEQNLMANEIKKITSSVSTLRIPNPKLADDDKISILDNDLGQNQQHGNINRISVSPKDELKRREPTLSTCIKQKISSVICTNENKMSSANLVIKKKNCTSGVLYNMLASCLDNMPDDMSGNPPSLDHSPLFVSKWIDYSNKYGFGYQLSDSSVGVFFNDLTRISLSPEKKRVEFHDSVGRITVHAPNALPAWLLERYQLLQYFGTYMEDNLNDAGDVRLQRLNMSQGQSQQHRNNQAVVPHIRRWDRTPKSIIMQLSCGTFQINFFKDHTKIVIAAERSDVIVMYISSDRVSFTYALSQLTDMGCDAAVRERLVYALSCLRQYAELDGEDV